MLDLPKNDDSLYAPTSGIPSSVAYLNLASQALDESTSVTTTMYVTLYFDVLFDRPVINSGSWWVIVDLLIFVIYIFVIYYY